MSKCFKTLVAIFLILIAPLAPIRANAELIASSSEPLIVGLNPLQNGLSAITFTWSLSDYAYNRVVALNAGLSTVVNGGTAELSPFRAETYREVNGISLGISTQPDDIMLTLSAPHDVFPLALDHLNALLTNPDFSQEWYRRELLRLAPVLATKNRRPSYVLDVLANYLDFPVKDDGVDVSDMTFQFGMPRQIIIRTPARNPKPMFRRAAAGLALRNIENQQTNRRQPGATLPKGVIFAPDPDSNETLIFLAKRQDFQSPSDQIATNLLMDYIGAYQGSEMFRIIRQELRAAYDPRTEVRDLAKDSLLLSLSATVPAESWPQILNEIEKIYTKTSRPNTVSISGLDNNKRRLLNGFNYNFATNPAWAAKSFLAEYPTGSFGVVEFPLFRALNIADLHNLRSATDQHLPPFEEYLLILIGGTLAPSDSFRSAGFCELLLSEPLSYCLTQLQE